MVSKLVIVALTLVAMMGAASAQVFGVCGSPGPIKVKVNNPEWCFTPCASSPVVPDYFTFRCLDESGDETSFRLGATQVAGTQDVTVPFADAWLLRPGENRVEFRPHSKNPDIQGATETITFLYIPPVIRFPAFGIKLISGGTE